MADAAETSNESVKKPGKRTLFVGLMLAVAGAAGGFFATSQGLVNVGETHVESESARAPESVGIPSDIGFVAVDPLIVSLGPSSGLNLRFRAQLEIREENRDDVVKMLPRVMDVLNSYLRAIDIEDVRDQSSLVRLRAQMLRRVQVVVGADRVHDLLVMEFVMN